MNDQRPVRIDYTAKDYEELRAGMLRLARERVPEWTDHSAGDLGVMLVELFASMGDVLSHYQDRIVAESYLATAHERKSAVDLLRLIGYELDPPRPASVELTLLLADDAPVPTTIPSGATFEAPGADGEPVRFRYDRGDLDLDPTALPVHTVDGEDFRRYDGLRVVQVDQVVRDEAVGSSDGSAGQRFPLVKSPVIADSLEVWVDEGTGPVLWERRDSLLNSGADDRHYQYAVDVDGSVIEFGDGRHGRAPARGHRNVVAHYRTGGGRRGNVSADTITGIVTSLDGLEQVFNPRDASGGRDRETVEEAARRAPRMFRAQDRAVTAADYESHALRFGVGKARARGAGWNRVELFVAPSGGGYPSDTLKEDLRHEFDARRMLGSILEIRDPRYVEVWVDATLHVDPYFYADDVRLKAEAAVRELLRFESVRFGDQLYLSKVYEALERIEGLQAVNVERFARSESGPPALPADGTLRFGWEEIPVAGHASGIRFTEVVGGQRAS